MALIKQLILLEGKNDCHVVAQLLHHHHINCLDADTVNSVELIEELCLKDTKSDNQLLEALSVYLDDGTLEVLGIVIDADEDIEGRWQAISGRLENAGTVAMPKVPNPDGTIIELEQTGRVLRIGIWIMPDNKSNGMLENFLQNMITDNDFLHTYAKDCVSKIPVDNRKFSRNHLNKAEICTWLAWQENPGRPYGVAIRAKYFDIASPYSISFTNWIKALFLDI